ncbi:hypothetical protein LPJ54_001941 [Coemansia sp. RSA 1824]|nr:hypothetical protein LPJ54_001941 [Coemansia sp. RSA 1824]
MSPDIDTDGVEVEGALAVATAIYHVLDNHPADIPSTAVCSAIGDIVRYVSTYMQFLDGSPYVSLLLETVMRIHSVVPGGQMFDKLFQIARCSASCISQHKFLESMLAITSGLKLKGKLSTNRGFELMLGVIQGYSGSLDANTGYMPFIAAGTAVVASILQEQAPDLCAPAEELLVSLRQFAKQSNEQPPSALPDMCLDFMQQVVEAEHGWMRRATELQIGDLKNALSYIINVQPSNIECMTQGRDVVRNIVRIALIIQREAERVSEPKPSAAGSLPWAFTASDVVDSEEQTTGDTLVPTEQRKRTHSPASSDDESEPTSKNMSRSPESQIAATNGSASSTPTMPRRSKRRRRSKRKARVSQDEGVSAQKAETERRISGLLDQLETEMQSVSMCGLGPLLQTQSRIAGIQQRLCDAMQQQAHID